MGQTYRNFELIILDDKSSDDSSKIIEQYRQVNQVTHIEYNDKNSGSTFAQWEKGLQLAQGEWVWLAESDDYADPLLLDTLIQLAQQKNNIAIAFCNSHWVDHNSVKRANLSLYNESFYRSGLDEIKVLCKHCTIQNASATLIKKEYALKAITGLSQYKACGDWIFYTRVLHYGDIVYTAQQLNYFRWYHANISNASKDRLWATEGVQVLENIDYHKVKFSKPAFFNMASRWVYKAVRLNYKDCIKIWNSIFKASARYLSS